MEKAVYKKFVREETVGPPPPEQGNGGSFRVYFQEKKRKLHHQFAKQQGNQRQDSQIFEGVRIHVNGHTVPSHQVNPFLDLLMIFMVLLHAKELGLAVIILLDWATSMNTSMLG